MKEGEGGGDGIEFQDDATAAIASRHCLSMNAVSKKLCLPFLRASSSFINRSYKQYKSPLHVPTDGTSSLSSTKKSNYLGTHRGNVQTTGGIIEGVAVTRLSIRECALTHRLLKSFLIYIKSGALVFVYQDITLLSTLSIHV